MSFGPVLAGEGACLGNLAEGIRVRWECGRVEFISVNVSLRPAISVWTAVLVLFAVMTVTS